MERNMEKTTLVDGGPVTDDHRQIDPATGLQKGYVVLSAEERAKGFVRPVRTAYRHVGPPVPLGRMRDLTEEEKIKFAVFGYVKYEEYGPEREPLAGRFWTEAEIRRIGGCNAVTSMHISIAETYARNPHFYSGTYCTHCRGHFPVGESGEFVWEGSRERVGT